MFCIVAFIVLAVLGIFSASHRALAREAFACVLRRVTFRPCTVGFKEKMHAHILSGIMMRSVTLARFVARRFELLSWLFFLLSIASLAFAGRSAFNYYMFGDCNGLDVSGFCVFDPTSANEAVSSVATSSSAGCPITSGVDGGKPTLAGFDTSLFPSKNIGAKDTVVLFGCFGCDYTRKAYPVIQEFLHSHTVNYTFVDFPIRSQYAYLRKVTNYAYITDPKEFWAFLDALFAAPKADDADPEKVYALAQTFGYDPDKMRAYAASDNAQKLFDEQGKLEDGALIYGTPTVFINGHAVVGPKPYRVYRNLLWWWGK